ncbi:MAG: motility associated factor glycosyltransferase family protein [Candidatus Omnitrophica bacterium]|nr:motility associated factor glycosyltransferase family protein [Candidatus Omnitrophota bacterium]
MGNNFYETNLGALKERYPQLYEKIVAHQDTLSTEMIDSRSGMPTLRVHGKFFHSAYDPMHEAGYLLEDLNLKQYEGIVLVGMGLGYHLKKIWMDPYFQGKMLIVEKNITVFKQALAASDLSTIIRDGLVLFVVEEDEQEAARIIEVCGFFRINITKVGVIIHPPSMQMFMEYYLVICKKIRSLLGFMRSSLGSLKQFQDFWVNNAMEDTVDIVASPGIRDLGEMGKGTPAIIVSAGPSLDRDIETIRQAKGKIFIFAVGTAYRVLLKNGIKPDVVVVVDAHEVILKQFKDIDPSGTYLFSANFVRKEIIDAFMPDVFFYFPSTIPYDVLLPDSQRAKGRAYAGGSVAHSALDIAVQLGFNPVILVGQDLSYASSGQTYASGSVYDGKTIQYQDERDFHTQGLVWMRGNYEDKVIGSQVFYIFVSSFEQYIRRHPEVTYINATSGGAYIEGTTLMPLAEVLSHYADKGDPAACRETMKKVQAGFVPNWEGFHEILEKVLNHFNQIVNDLESSCEKAKHFKMLLKEGHQLPKELQTIPTELIELGKRLDENSLTALLQYGKGYFKFLIMNMELRSAQNVRQMQEVFCNSVEEVYEGFLETATFIRDKITDMLNRSDIWKKTENIR